MSTLKLGIMGSNLRQGHRFVGVGSRRGCARFAIGRVKIVRGRGVVFKIRRMRKLVVTLRFASGMKTTLMRRGGYTDLRPRYSGRLGIVSKH